MISPKSSIFILILSILSFLTYGQDLIKKYVQDNTAQIATIDPNAIDYSDLEIIGKAIANASVVMIGEQDHGDAATFLAKTRLIKYLHEQKGFNVLAFESDFFSLNKGWDQLKKEKDLIASFLRLNIYPIWSYCDACSTLLYEYIPSTYSNGHPLEITGFDSDLILDYASRNLIRNLDSLIRHLGLPLAKSKTYRSQILPALDSLKFGFSSTLSASFYRRTSAYLLAIQSQMVRKLSKDHFWIQVLDNLIGANCNYEARNTDIIKSFNARDFQMAKNLRWLTHFKYPGKKMIVWAANTHIGKSKDTLIKNKSGQGFTAMGAYFTQDTLQLNNTYMLGFTSLKGKAGRLTMKEYTIPTPALSTFESWIDTTYQYAFIDFRNFNKTKANASEGFYLKGFTHFPEKDNWMNVFDGIFFIKEMYPCK
jgi:erythromycin esterase-like protein